MHFCGTLINCNEDISICHEQIKQLKEDVKDWEKRCVNETLESMEEIQRYFNGTQQFPDETQRYFNERRREINSSGCMIEKKYVQERMRIHTKTCFYEGKLIDIF